MFVMIRMATRGPALTPRCCVTGALTCGTVVSVMVMVGTFYSVGDHLVSGVSPERALAVRALNTHTLRFTYVLDVCYLTSGLLLFFVSIPHAYSVTYSKASACYLAVLQAATLCMLPVGCGLLINYSTLASFRASLAPRLAPGLQRLLRDAPYYTRPPHNASMALNARLLYTELGQNVNYVQTRYKCCGVNSGQDYRTANFSGRYSLAQPHSCCVLLPEHQAQTSGSTNVQPSHVLNHDKCEQRKEGFSYNRGCSPILQFILYNTLKWDLINVLMRGIVVIVLCLFVSSKVVYVLVERRVSGGQSAPVPSQDTPAPLHTDERDLSQFSLLTIQGEPIY